MTDPDYMLLKGDSLEMLKLLPDESIDSVVCDPPYGLSKEPDMAEVLTHWLAGDDYEHRGGGFMGKRWDSFVPGPALWREALRVLKPGGHLLAFAGTRTADLMGISIRLAGFECRDSIQLLWLHGQGFPKGQDLGKAVDKQGGEGEPWTGWSSQLKPAHEPILMFRKPFKGPLVQNVLEHGAGAINIDACRVGTDKMVNQPGFGRWNNYRHDGKYTDGDAGAQPTVAQGRHPANVVLAHHEECRAEGSAWDCHPDCSAKLVNEQGGESDVSRFFYTAKASKAERNAGLPEGSTNKHPTVKPLSVMEWLVRLVTPIDGVVLDPFCGSGTTLCAAVKSGFDCIGIDLDEDDEYLTIAEHRILHWMNPPAS